MRFTVRPIDPNAVTRFYRPLKNTQKHPGIDTLPQKVNLETSYRTAYCHSCRSYLDERYDEICPRCGWLICSTCGACGCDF